MVDHGPAFVPEASPRVPPKRQLTGVWDFVVRGSRPVGLWVGNAILAVNFVAVPIADLMGNHVQRLTLGELAVVAALTGLGWHQRTQEKKEGLTS